MEGGESESEVRFNKLSVKNQLIINIINFFEKGWPKVIKGGESESEVSFS